MAKGNDIITFRANDDDKAIIEEVSNLLGMPNNSATLRILLNQGRANLDNFFKAARNVTHPLKYSEIDYFTTALNIYLKKKKRDQMELNDDKLGKL